MQVGKGRHGHGMAVALGRWTRCQVIKGMALTMWAMHCRDKGKDGRSELGKARTRI